MALHLKDRQIERLNDLLTLDIDHVEILRWDYHETIRYPRNILSCCIDTREAISVGGFLAQNGDQVQTRLESRGNYVSSGSWKFYNIVLEESCTMAKPYKTDTYPLIPKEDKILMGMVY